MIYANKIPLLALKSVEFNAILITFTIQNCLNCLTSRERSSECTVIEAILYKESFQASAIMCIALQSEQFRCTVICGQLKTLEIHPKAQRDAILKAPMRGLWLYKCKTSAWTPKVEKAWRIIYRAFLMLQGCFQKLGSDSETTFTYTVSIKIFSKI